jgi:hypothetical protein
MARRKCQALSRIANLEGPAKRRKTSESPLPVEESAKFLNAYLVQPTVAAAASYSTNPILQMCHPSSK